MFTPPRFVVVDDDEKHLAAIVTTIQELGSACARVHYTPERDVPAALFRTVRAIFIDLQLQDRSASSDMNRHYAEIQRILGNVINDSNGPYLLIVWTDAPEAVSGLDEYLAKRFFEEKPYARPVSILPLSKTDYIDLGTGNEKGRDLLEAIRQHLKANGAASALMQWEVEVLGAAAGVVADVTTLATELDGEAPLPTLLRRLAIEAVGLPNVDKEQCLGLQAALLPLLQDNLQNAPAGGAEWSRVFEGAADPLPALSKPHVSRLNTKLHALSLSADRPISPLAWGAVCELEAGVDWSEFGLTDAEEYKREVVARRVKLNLASYGDAIKVVQIRIGAACDYAQKTTGPIPYALAALLPARPDQKSHDLVPKSTSWISPEVDFGAGTVQLFVEPRFVRVRGESAAKDFVPLGRMKEQLLLELVSTIGQHNSRPGIVRFVATG